MNKKFIDGYEVPVYHFNTPAEREAFLDEWLTEGQKTEKGLYMGHDAIYVNKDCETVMVATI